MSACLEEDHPISDIDSQRFKWAIEQVRRILKEDPMNQISQRELIPGTHLNDEEETAWVIAFGLHLVSLLNL